MLYLFLLGRILLGGYFIMNGYNHFKHLANMTGYAKSKGLPMPRESVILSGAMLFLGGLGVVLGVWVELAVLLLVLFLVGTLLKMHTYWTVTDPMARMGRRDKLLQKCSSHRSTTYASDDPSTLGYIFDVNSYNLKTKNTPIKGCF